MAILAIARLRDALRARLKNSGAAGNRPLTLNALIALCDEAERLADPAPKVTTPEWPKIVFGKFTGKRFAAGTPEKLERMLNSGRFVSDSSQCEGPWPRMLWKDGNPSPNVVYNKWEESVALQAGYKPDEERSRGTKTYSRQPDASGTWQAFMTTCEDPALLALVQLRWNESCRGPYKMGVPCDALAGHLSDVLSEYYFPIPNEEEV